VNDEAKCTHLRKLLNQIFKLPHGTHFSDVIDICLFFHCWIYDLMWLWWVDNTEFPGSMPIVFSRRYFPIVQTKPYFVSEKTDGIRYLMLVLPEGIYCIDRKYHFRYLRFDLLSELYAQEGTFQSFLQCFSYYYYYYFSSINTYTLIRNNIDYS
jgi:hypothetical protein